jgi:hypothetical protein
MYERLEQVSEANERVIVFARIVIILVAAFATVRLTLYCYQHTFQTLQERKIANQRLLVLRTDLAHATAFAMASHRRLGSGGSSGASPPSLSTASIAPSPAYHHFFHNELYDEALLAMIFEHSTAAHTSCECG